MGEHEIRSVTFAAAPAAPAASAPRAEEGFAYDRRAMVRRGVRAGLEAGLAMIVWLMVCGEVAAAPTTVRGISSDSWTAITAVTGSVFGTGAFHGSFHVLSILFGLGVLLALSAALGALGALVVAETVGPAAGPVPAVIVTLSYAAILQVLLLDLLVNSLQQPDLVYHAIPPWGWLLATATYGIVLGLRLARLSRRAQEREPERR